MADVAALEAAVAAAREGVTKQGDTVRSLKADLKEGKVDRVRSHPSGVGATAAAHHPPPPPRTSPARRPPPPQAAVDAAIEALKNMKLDMERQQKVRAAAGGGGGACSCRRRFDREQQQEHHHHHRVPLPA